MPLLWAEDPPHAAGLKNGAKNGVKESESRASAAWKRVFVILGTMAAVAAAAFVVWCLVLQPARDEAVVEAVSADEWGDGGWRLGETAAQGDAQRDEHEHDELSPAGMQQGYIEFGNGNSDALLTRLSLERTKRDEPPLCEDKGRHRATLASKLGSALSWAANLVYIAARVPQVTAAAMRARASRSWLSPPPYGILGVRLVSFLPFHCRMCFRVGCCLRTLLLAVDKLFAQRLSLLLSSSSFLLS
eukprot:5153726-Pleurochrysis_carterae.AAC.2